MTVRVVTRRPSGIVLATADAIEHEVAAAAARARVYSGLVNATEDEVLAAIGSSLPPSGAWAPNQPAGLTQILDSQFDPEDWPENLEEVGAGGWQRWADVTQHTVTAGHQFGNTHSVRKNQPGNSLGGGFGSSTIYRQPLPSGMVARRMYLCAEIRLAAENPSLIYSVHEPGGEKFWYPNRNLGPGGGSALELTPPSGEAHDDPHAGFKMLTQDGSDPGWLTQETGPYLTKDQWELLEIYMQMDTPGNSNGIIRIWINDVLAWELTDVSYSTSGSQDGWVDGPFDDTRGGGNSNNPTPAGGQYREFARWRLAASSSLS